MIFNELRGKGRGAKTRLMEKALLNLLGAKYPKLAERVAAGALVIILGLCVIRSETRAHNEPPTSFAHAANAMGQTN